MINVIEVTGKKLMKKFVEFPLKLYKNNPYFVPAFFGDEVKLLFPEKSIYADSSKSKFFLAYKGDEIVGRIAGLIVYPYIEKTQRKVIRFSRFDLIDDFEVAKALFKAIEDFAITEGLNEIQGPMGYTDLDREGLLIEGFDKISTFAENYSYEYYVKHIENNGFKKEVDWIEHKLNIPTEPSEKIHKIAGMVAKRFKLREAITKDISLSKLVDNYADGIFNVINKAYAPLHGTIPLQGKVVKDIITQFKLILSPDFISVILNENNEVVGFGAVLPSITKELIRSRGKLTPVSIYRLLKLKKKPKSVEFALIAILPEYQKKGLNAMIMDKIEYGLIAKGVKYAETNLELESNSAVLSLWEGFDKEFIKRRRCYIKKI